MSCPRCRAGLEVVTAEPSVLGCPSCRGAFFDNAASHALIDGALPSLVQSSYVMAPERAPEPADAVGDGAFRRAAPVERRCPTCGERMVETVAAGVTLDVCAAHGTWLDAGEADLLRRGLAFEAAQQKAQQQVAVQRRASAIEAEASELRWALREPPRDSRFAEIRLVWRALRALDRFVHGD